jgi:hypothetical protein
MMPSEKMTYKCSDGMKAIESIGDQGGKRHREQFQDCITFTDAPKEFFSDGNCETPFIFIEDREVFYARMKVEVWDVMLNYFHGMFGEPISEKTIAMLSEMLNRTMLNFLYSAVDRGYIKPNMYYTGDPYHAGEWKVFDDGRFSNTLTICFGKK